ncbi:sensor histidine kinase [Streptomyces sp. HNM0575]|uniref:sensor histidine kinase n=1 Tax=Streptomyces sp. HNM0575 TaxID=2716338 RepID=UPI00145F0C64|nr:sensor histidine kinase [Streptomyces sp. HNM0575]NLU72498.1 sensor histidine kinase [Streptomyces sp. HNM0575]
MTASAHPSGPGGTGDHGEERLPPPAPVLGAQTWREIAHLLCNMPVGVAGFVYVTVCICASAGLSFTLIGLPLLALTLLGARGLGRFERARARLLLRVRIDEPSPLRAREDGFLSWLWTQLKDPVAWRHVLYFFVRLPWGWLSFGVMLPALFVLWPVLPWLARGLTNVDRALVRGLLSPSDELERRIAELESDRGSVADTAAADLRRIERDLHDGAQARLVTLAMDLGLAKEKLLEDPQAAADMVDEAHGEVKLALQELRDLARGIHPAILTDRGLGPALSALATRCTADVTITVDLPQRPAQAIEGITYFTASELLQNITKHSTAHTAHIDLWKTDDRLLLHVTDDGKGGAHTNTGTGLAGLTDRLTAVDGLLLIHSPTGGPTTITAELPWRGREIGHDGSAGATGGTGTKDGRGKQPRTKRKRLRRVH